MSEQQRFVHGEPYFLERLAGLDASISLVGEGVLDPRFVLPDADAQLTFEGGSKRTIPLLTADRTYTVDDAGWKNSNTIDVARSDRSQFVARFVDPSGAVLYSAGGAGVVTIERDAGNWRLRGANNKATGDRTIQLDPRAGTNRYGTGQAAIDHAALQAVLSASGGDVVIDAGTAELPRAFFFAHKRLVYRGNFGTGFRLGGAVRTLAASRGTGIIWQGFLGDDDGFKTAIASSLSIQTYSGAQLNGAIGTGTIQGGPPAGVTSWTGIVADERFGVVTLLGPDSAWSNGSYAQFTGIDDQGGAVTTPAYILFDAALPGFLHTPQALAGFDIGTDTFTLVGHGYAVGDAVRLRHSGGDAFLPLNFYHFPTYYVIAAGFSASTFRLSLTPGGAAVNGQSALVATTYIGRHARAFRTSERLRSVSSIEVPAMASTAGLVLLGFEGGTVLDMAGAIDTHLHHFSIDGNHTATTCLAYRFDLARMVGSSSNVIEQVVCGEFNGPLSSGLALGQTYDGVSSYQTDTTTAFGLWCYVTAPTADETGVRFLESGNCLTASFLECNLNGVAWGVDARQGNGNIVVSGCRFGSIRQGLVNNGGAVQLISPSNEQGNFGAYYYYSTSAVSSVDIAGGDLRGRAPAADDIMIVSYGTVNHRDGPISNSRTASSWARYAVAAPSMIVTNLASRLDLRNVWINKYPGYCAPGGGFNALAVSVNAAGDFLNPQDLASLGEYGISISGCCGGVGGALVQLPDYRGSLPSHGTYGLYFPLVGTGITRQRVGMPARFLDRTNFTFGAFNVDSGDGVGRKRVGLVSKETRLVYVYVRVSQLFAEGAGALTISVGTTAGGGELLVATDVKAGAVPFRIGDAAADLGAILTGAAFVQGGVVLAETANTPIFLSVNGIVSALTAGEASIVICTEPMRELF